ncbi:hypothetical protein DSS3PM1_00068 [Bacteriophage DSS3_PM1]|uniref:Tail assembly chaperone n=1 Tax=Bacteriophage DSS3_VP1 TaxID=2664196 RepID=A0A7S5FQA5_9CAUD|nr:hypothetical protein KNU84_gp100 [Bacteriophage DSS3_VP1]QGH74604.1 hypothetical protein DSS3VP1_00036 [Bacteriophage DSS3_VP1]QGH74744.1 hypothetical protein DSS3PM1_00068 [Bacteriophage DSS3_PM1]
MKNLVGKRVEKSVDFVGDQVVIRKLSVSEVMEVQKLVAEHGGVKEGDDPSNPMALVRGVIRLGVNGADELTDEDFDTFPIDELNTLVSAVLAFSGIGEEAAKEAEGN